MVRNNPVTFDHIDSIRYYERRLQTVQGGGFIGDDIVNAIGTYNDATIALQNVADAKSWSLVFGPDGSHNPADLKPQSDTDQSRDSLAYFGEEYAEAKKNYEKVISDIANDWISDRMENITYGKVKNSQMSGFKRDLSEDIPIDRSESTGIIYGARSVYIAAQTLNINGTIRSGILDYTIVLNSTEVIDAIDKGIAGGHEVIDLTNILVTAEDKGNIRFFPKVEYKDGAIHVDNIKAMGGDITLAGNIISTGKGEIIVADGYGDITIIGNDKYDLVLGVIDTGLGAEGRIHIIDTAWNTEDNPYSLNTVYTRVNGDVDIKQYFLVGEEEIQLDVGNSDTTNYRPLENQWLKTVMSNSTTLEWEYTYISSAGLWGAIDFLAADSKKVTGGRGSSTINKSMPVGTSLVFGDSKIIGDLKADAWGVYLLSVKPVEHFQKYYYDSSGNLVRNQGARGSDDYTARLVHIDSDGDGTGGNGASRNWSSGFLGFNSNSAFDFLSKQTFTETFTTYLNASKEIIITFKGNETAGSVKITGEKSITLGDLVRSSHDLTIISNSGNIIAGENVITGKDNALLIAQDITLSAVNGSIGTPGVHEIPSGVDEMEFKTETLWKPLNIETVLGGTTLNVDAKDSVNLDVTGPRLLVGSVTGRDIDIASTGDILMSNWVNGSERKSGELAIDAGNTVTLAAGYGRIGSATNNGNKDGDFDENGYFLMSAGGNVKATASDHIRIKHVGDLFVDQIISTGGDLDIWVQGNIRDKNEVFAIDPFSDAETLLGDAKSLGLVVNTPEYQDRINNRIAAYEREFTELYFKAWDDYNQGKYDPNYAFKYSDKVWEDLRNSALSAEQIRAEEQKFLAEEQKRTDAYHNAILSGYQGDYVYTATQAEVAALTEFTEWTEDQLKNQLAIPLFLLTQDAGTRQNTTSLIEEPNFAGRNITLYATGAIGNQDDEKVNIPVGKTFEKLKESAGDDWDLWRRTMADAEWDDVEFGTDYYTFTRYDDVNIAATGWLKTTSAYGATYLGSQSDVAVDTIISGAGISGTDGSEQLRLKVDGNLVPFDRSTLDAAVREAMPPFVANIIAKNAILEAAGGTLGLNVDSPLTLNLTGINNDSWIVARGTDGVYLSFVNAQGAYADVNIREIGSTQGDVYLWAASMFADLPEGMSKESAKIGGSNIVLVALGSIGSEDDPLRINQRAGGFVALDATDNIYVYGTTSLDIGKLVAGGSVVDIYAVGNLLLTDAELDVVGNATFTSVLDIIVAGGTANLGNSLLTAGHDILIDDWMLTVLGTLDMTAANNLSATNANIQAEDTNLTATSGDMALDNGTAALGNTQLVSGGNISLADWVLTVPGTLDMTAANNLSTTNANIVAGDTNLTATSGDMTLANGTAALDNTQLVSGGNVSLTDWVLTVLGTLDMIAANNLSTTNANIGAGDTNLTTTNGNMTIMGSVVQFSNAQLRSGNDIAILNSPQFDVTGFLGIDAANHLTLMNVTGNIGMGEFNAAQYSSPYSLFDWHFYTGKLLLSSIDIYNDPAYRNSLSYDRIIRLKKSGSREEEEDDYELNLTIGGCWLSEEDDFLKTLNEQEPAIVPVSESTSVSQMMKLVPI